MSKIKIDENKLKILKARDKTDSQTIHHPVISLPARALLCAKSGLGKSTILLNIFCSDLFGYNKIFKPEDIYIFCPDIEADQKLMHIVNYYDLDINNNVYQDKDKPDLEGLQHVYNGLVEENKQEAKHSAIIIDDYSSSGEFCGSKKFNILAKIFCNSRKANISTFFLQQHYMHCNPTIRLNANFICLGNTSNHQLKIIEQEHNMHNDPKFFKSMFRHHTKNNKNDFFSINYTNDNFDDIYLDKDFKKINIKEFEQIYNEEMKNKRKKKKEINEIEIIDDE